MIPGAGTTLWRLMFAFNLVLLVPLAFSFPFQPPGSPSRAIALLSFGIIGASLLGLGAIIYADWNPF